MSTNSTTKDNKGPRDLEYFADVYLIIKEQNNNDFLSLLDHKDNILSSFRQFCSLIRTNIFDSQEARDKYNGGFTYSKVYRVRFNNRVDFYTFCGKITLILDNWKYINIVIGTHMMPLDKQENLTPGCSRIE